MKLPYVDEFLGYRELYDDVAKNTIVNYLNDLKIFFEFTDGKYNVRKATFNNFVDHLLNERNEARTTVNRRLASLKSYYRYLYNNEIIDFKIYDRIEFVKEGPRKTRKLPSRESIIKKLESINDVRDRALLETMYSTGVREGELSALNISDIDFKNKLVTISRSSSKSNRTKGGRTRVIPIGEEALKWIKAYLVNRKEGPLFLNNKYTRLGERGIYNIVKGRLGISPHDLRHAFATHLIAETGNIKAVSEMLGHSSVAMTERIYTHLTSEHLKDVHRRGFNR